jgi:23S rRNA (cytosine1962-C5)-methyltransferase
MTHQLLQFKKGADRRLRQGHPWIYSNEIDVAKTPLKIIEPGVQCQVLNSAGKPVATAFVNSNSLICGRLISRHPQTWMDKSLMVHRINIALSLRDKVFGKPFYRLLFGDSDGMPGVVVDRFGDVLVLQISIAGMERLKEELIEALVKVLKPTSIIIKNDAKMREHEGMSVYVETAYGHAVEIVSLEENNVAFNAPVLHGQKTGWFYDHRMSRARLGQYVKGKRVLDVFSYIGGWGVQAAAMGADQVCCVDSSALALDFVEVNAELNSAANKVSTVKGDAFDVLKQMREERQRFDVVIMDPPAFIPRKKRY